MIHDIISTLQTVKTGTQVKPPPPLSHILIKTISILNQFPFNRLLDFKLNFIGNIIYMYYICI